MAAFMSVSYNATTWATEKDTEKSRKPRQLSMAFLEFLADLEKTEKGWVSPLDMEAEIADNKVESKKQPQLKQTDTQIEELPKKSKKENKQ